MATRNCCCSQRECQEKCLVLFDDGKQHLPQM